MNLSYDELNARRVDELSREIGVLARARIAREPDAPRINLAQLVLDLSTGRTHGENREALEEYARRSATPFEPMRPAVPFSALWTRDVMKASASAGGYLAGAETQQALDVLRPWSVTARAGIQVEVHLVGDQVLPKVSAKSAPNWLSTEGSQGTTSQPTLVQIAASPKSVIGLTAFSRQLSRQANAERFVRSELSRTIGTAVDQAVLSGTGASGQPLGLLNTAGVQTQSGATLNAGVQTMKRKCAEANVADERIASISTPAVRELLEGRERATGGGRFVWQDDRVADRPAFVTTDMPAATLAMGDWANIWAGFWGDGSFVLEINPSDPSGFRVGTIQARVIVSMDVGVLHPAGFVVAPGVT